MGQHLSGGECDLATLTLEVTALVGDAGLRTVYGTKFKVRSLVGLRARKILRINYVHCIRCTWHLVLNYCYLIPTFILWNFPFARYCAVSIARDTASIWSTIILTLSFDLLTSK